MKIQSSCSPFRVRLRLAGLGLLLVLAGGASSWAAVQATDHDPSWSELKPAQQEVLQPLQVQWSTLEYARKKKWLEIANQFEQLNPDERTKVQARMTEWARMSPEQRHTARANFEQIKKIESSERSLKWQAYQALPEDQKKQLATQAKQTPKKPVTTAPKTPAMLGLKRNLAPNPQKNPPPQGYKKRPTFIVLFDKVDPHTLIPYVKP